MKNFILFASLTFSFAAHADVAVGDQAKYSMQTKEIAASATMNFQTTFEVLGINSLNQTANVQQTIYEGGVILTQNAFDQNLSDMLNPTADDIANCALLATNDTAATVESIRVKAGTFSCCHLKSITPTLTEI